jgi:hypothetical protein
MCLTAAPPESGVLQQNLHFLKGEKLCLLKL